MIVLGWDAEAPQLDWALACGAHGRLSKTMRGPELVAGLEQINLDRDRARRLPQDWTATPRCG